MRLITVVVCCLSLGVVALAEASWKGDISVDGPTATLRVDSPRCLASAIYTLWWQYGVSVNYEEVPHVLPADIVDVTVAGYRATDSAKRALDPRGGLLTVTFPLNTQLSFPKEPENLLRKLMEEHVKRGYPGEYKLEVSTEGVYDVLPVARMVAANQRQALTPVLNTEISMAALPGRTLKEVISSVIASLNVGGTKVIPGKILAGTAAQQLFEDPVVEMPARNLFEMLTHRLGGHHLTLLLWDPSSQAYVLSYL